RRLKATFVYVTHDQVEAMTLSDRIAVLRAGELQQVASPREIYARPANRFVAEFFGTPRINVVPPRILGLDGDALAGGRPGDARGKLPPPPWGTTDDTEMALEIALMLEANGRVDQDALAKSFAERFRRRPDRGYGGGAMRLLNAIDAGKSWRTASKELFRGEG